MWGVELFVMVTMVVINSIFAAYEIALTSVSLPKLQSLAPKNGSAAASAVRMKSRMEASLAVIQLGITLVGAIAAATGGAGAEESIEPILLQFGIKGTAAEFLSILVVVVPLTIVTIVFGELVPKIFAMRNKEWVCLKLSPSLEWFAYSVWPAVWMLEKSVMAIIRLTDFRSTKHSAEEERAEEAALQELRAVASLARTSRLIGLREEAIIMNAARLTSTPVRNVMLPAQYIAMLNVKDSLEKSLIAAHHDMHTRFPVTEEPGNPQAIIGYVNFKDLVAMLRMAPSNPSLRGILRPLSQIRDNIPTSECLETMIQERIHIALVSDADRRIIGMLTLEDILEELVGEIHDEYDRLPTTITRSGNGWIIGGHATLPNIQSTTGLTIVDKEPSVGPKTLNDWVVRKLGKPVEGGEILVSDGIRVVVRKVRRQLVQEALVDTEVQSTKWS